MKHTSPLGWHRIVSLLSVAVLSGILFSCSALKDLESAMTNLSRCQFKLDNVNGFELMGVSLSNKKGLSDFSTMDGLKLTRGFLKGEFPAAFTLNVAARNPNDGSGGSPSATATMTKFAWRLFIDDVETVNGLVTDPITIPGTGQTSIIPLKLQLDLGKFFKDRGYEKVVDLALAIGGVNGSPSRLTLRAKPEIQTKFGAIQYPGEIDIVDREFR